MLVKHLQRTKSDLVVERGKEFTETYTIRPRTSGRTEVRVELESFGAGVNHIAAARDQIITTPEAEIYPISPEYESAKNGLLIRNIVIAVVAVIALIGVVMMVYSAFRRWLDREKPGNFTP